MHPKGVLIGYARVSTLDQNLTLQRDALTAAGCTKLFVEQMSGMVLERPALRDALEFARADDTIVVWKLDRLARSMSQLIETLEALRLRNIGFRSLTEALDTTTPQGRLVFHLFGALAEFERGLIRERTSAGLAAARRLGRTGGRPAKLTDDDLDVATTLLANPDITVAEIAERVGVSPATLYRYLPAARTAHALKDRGRAHAMAVFVFSPTRLAIDLIKVVKVSKNNKSTSSQTLDLFLVFVRNRRNNAVGRIDGARNRILPHSVAGALNYILVENK